MSPLQRNKEVKIVVVKLEDQHVIWLYYKRTFSLIFIFDFSQVS